MSCLRRQWLDAPPTRSGERGTTALARAAFCVKEHDGIAIRARALGLRLVGLTLETKSTFFCLQLLYPLSLDSLCSQLASAAAGIERSGANFIAQSFCKSFCPDPGLSLR